MPLLLLCNLTPFSSVCMPAQVHELFSLVGQVQRIIMGLDRIQKTPCGFCFVMYHKRSDAMDAIKYLNGTLLDNRLIRVDIDYGFLEGRQFGRGRSGGQVSWSFSSGAPNHFRCSSRLEEVVGACPTCIHAM